MFHCVMFLQVINNLQLLQTTYYAGGGVSESQSMPIYLVKETITLFHLWCHKSLSTVLEAEKQHDNSDF